jgi:hypothetical protein
LNIVMSNLLKCVGVQGASVIYKLVRKICRSDAECESINPIANTTWSSPPSICISFPSIRHRSHHYHQVRPKSACCPFSRKGIQGKKNIIYFVCKIDSYFEGAPQESPSCIRSKCKIWNPISCGGLRENSNSENNLLL